jgi:malate dehydrogenase
MSVLTCLDGEYCFSRVSIGVPVVLGNEGVEKIVELELSNQSKQKLEKFIAVVEEALTMLKRLTL